jgi:hypothetical protein
MKAKKEIYATQNHSSTPPHCNAFSSLLQLLFPRCYRLYMHHATFFHLSDCVSELKCTQFTTAVNVKRVEHLPPVAQRLYHKPRVSSLEAKKRRRFKS